MNTPRSTLDWQSAAEPAGPRSGLYRAGTGDVRGGRDFGPHRQPVHALENGVGHLPNFIVAHVGANGVHPGNEAQQAEVVHLHIVVLAAGSEFDRSRSSRASGARTKLPTSFALLDAFPQAAETGFTVDSLTAINHHPHRRGQQRDGNPEFCIIPKAHLDVSAGGLSAPQGVSATSTKTMAETAPLASIVTYEFAEREGMPPVRLIWYDGGLQPPRPVELGGQSLPEEGALYLGDEGKLLYSWGGIKLLPESREAKAKDIPKTLPRRPGTWREWFEACTGGEPAGCHFDWAVPLTELVLLGNIAIRTGKPLAWDSARMTFTNHAPANQFVQEPYHNGWSLETKL